MRSTIKAAFRIMRLRTDNSSIYTHKFLERQISKFGWNVGKNTYGKPTILGEGRGNLEIGDFCSIAPKVTIFLNGHNVNHASTYPFYNLDRDNHSNLPMSCDPHSYSKGGVKIGNDVWIGRGVFILDGVTIGDGAVIGAGSVVTRNVPDYAIAAGNPAKIIRFRFSKSVIDSLLTLKWWTYDKSILDANRHLFLLPPEELISRFRSNKG